MAPLRGRTPKGERLIGRAPHGPWRTRTFVAALRHNRIDAPFVLDGPVNGEAFRTYVEHLLLSTLSPGDVLVMDNLGSNKGQAVRDAIRAAKAHLLFLRPTALTSTPSSRSLPSSSTCCATRPNGQWKQPGAGSDLSSTASHPGNANTSLSAQDTLQPDLIPL